ncbi:550_t:CDS:1 [Ambispora gerdemannii]|uniref:550_t:CDS:1 n=1 Tax=Ambispora gerdemannii TaxID=144530 RepID=A0A9N9CSC2_9GLOM|nr:550_t:CDS:1 [Ambispora gerdemannii]
MPIKRIAIGELYQSFETSHSSPFRPQKSHLTINFSKLTVTLGNNAPQKWSFIPCTMPGYSNGFYIVNTTQNLALEYDLYMGEIVPSPLVVEKESFIWKRALINVWKDQDDYCLTPFKDPSRRLTTEMIQIPVDDHGTLCNVTISRLCGIAGTLRNQAWVFEEDSCEQDVCAENEKLEDSEISDVELPLKKNEKKSEKYVKIIDELKDEFKEIVNFRWVAGCIVIIAMFIIEKRK